MHKAISRKELGRRKAASAQARLHTLVTRLSGCLSTLSPQAQRVLVLRAGIGSAPLSSGAVAQKLHLSSAREATVERSALAALQSAGRAGGCGSTGGEAVLLTAPEGLALLDGPAGQGKFASAAVSSGLASRVAAFHEDRKSKGAAASGPQSLLFQNAAISELPSTNTSAAIWTLAAIMMFVALALLAATGRRFGAQRRLGLAGEPRLTGDAGLAGASSLAAGPALTAMSAVAAPADGAATDEAPPSASDDEPAAPEDSDWLVADPPFAESPTTESPTPESPTPDSPPLEPPAWVSSPAAASPMPAHSPSSEQPSDPSAVGPIQRSQSWLRQHSSEVALGVTVVTGALRLLARGRRGRRR